MSIDIQFQIMQDYRLSKFLRENSYLYKYLNRSPFYFDEFVDLMKDKYGLKTTDRINRLFDNINMIGTFLEALR